MSRGLCLFFLLFYSISSMAVEVVLQKSGEKPVSRIEVSAMKKHLHDVLHFKPKSDKDVERIVEENKMLADAFLEEHSKDTLDMALISIELNERLADQFVKELNKKIEIPDDVVKSYYLEHIEKYKKAPLVKTKIFLFKTLPEAMIVFKFSTKHDPEKTISFIDTNISKEDVKKIKYNVPESLMRPEVKTVLVHGKEHYFTPPQYYKGKYMLVFVDKIEKEQGYIPYDKVKKEILYTLKKQNFLKERQNIIDEMRNQK